MQTTYCPSLDELQLLAVGLIGDDAAGPLERHLLECPACIERMGGLPADDTLLNALKAPSTVKEHPAQNDLLRQLAARLDDLSHVTLSTQLDLTNGSGGGGKIGGRGEGGLDQSAARDADGRPIATNAYAFLAPAELPGEIGRLGGYRVLRVLGSGGMGVVFEAEDPRLKRHVALKVMKPDLAARVQSRQRFLREAQAMAALDHDHVVTVYQVGEDAGVPFLAMQFLQGESLAARLERQASGTRECVGKSPLSLDNGSAEEVQSAAKPTGRLTPPARLSMPELIRIGREIADGLAAAHERGLIHRDIKPGNIWLETTRGRTRVKILDFGLARVTEGAEELTHSAAVLGTPSYMAPEQARGEPVDARADLFSLGCVLYRMATGQAPFKGNSPLSVLMSLAVTTPPAPRALNPDIPPELDDLIVSLLSKDPAARPASARDVMERLASVGNGAPSGPRAVPPLDERLQASGVGHQDEGSGFGQVAQPPSAVASADAAVLPLPPGEGRGEGGLPAVGLDRAEQTGQLTALPNDGGGIANCELQVASCKLEDDNRFNPESVIPPRRRTYAALAAASAAAALLAGILVIIKDEKGRTIAQMQTNGPAEVTGLADRHTATIEEKADLKTQEAKAKTVETQDPKTNSSAADPIVALFNWVNKVGGRHYLFGGQTHHTRLPEILSLTDIGSDALNPLTMKWLIDLNGCQKVTDSDLKRFRSITKPLALWLNETNVSDVGLAGLRELSALLELRLEKTPVTRAGIESLGAMPNLFRIDLFGTSTSDADLAVLSRFPKLSMVMLGAPHLTVLGVESLSKLHNLHYLYLGRDVGEAEIERATTLSQLTGMCAYSHYVTAFDDACLEHLKNLPKLTNLNLARTAVTDAGMARLPVVAPRLGENLDLGFTAISDVGLKHLHAFTAL